MRFDPITSAIVSLGSNLGDSKQNVREALKALETLSTEPVVPSSLWETQPIDCPPGTPSFINAIAIVVPREMDPLAFLRALHAIEDRAGRLRAGRLRNASRELDLDLISFREQLLESAELTLPHPRAWERAFVLAPLSELAPDYVPVGHAKTIRGILNTFDLNAQKVRRL